jgi:hypothetical protein
MKAIRHLAALAAALLLPLRGFAQEGQLAPPAVPTMASNSAPDAPAASPWSLYLYVDGYIVPHGQSYVSPIFTADRAWLHLEARYNYEDQRTGSLWFGYNFKRGRTVTLVVTPMFGTVMGDTTGVAPGYEVLVAYQKLSFFDTGEYVFDARNRKSDYFFNWPEAIYSPWNWFRVGFAAQETKVYRAHLSTQAGFLAGVSHKRLGFTTYVFNPGSSTPTVLLEASVRF